MVQTAVKDALLADCVIIDRCGQRGFVAADATSIAEPSSPPGIKPVELQR